MEKKTQNKALEKAGKHLTTLNNAKESLKKEKKAFDVIRKNWLKYQHLALAFSLIHFPNYYNLGIANRH